MENSLMLSGELRLAEETEKNDGTLKKFSGVAYSGGAVSQRWSKEPIYVDLSTLRIRQQVPLMVDHNTYDVTNRVGICDAKVVDNQLQVTGVIDTATEKGAYLAKTGANIPWQMSIGADPGNVLVLKEGDKSTVNGMEVEGPCAICQDYTLYEISIVSVGADANTECRIAASFVSSSIDPNAKPQTSENKMENTEKNIQAAKPAETIDASAIQAAAVASERKRIADINRICAKTPEIASQAIEAGWTVEQTAMKALEAITAKAPETSVNVIVKSAEENPDDNILRAAMMETAGVSEASRIKACGEKNVEAAHSKYRGNLGVQELLLTAAKQSGTDCGYRVTMSNAAAVIRASAASVVNVGGILGGVIDRRLADGFDAVDQSWREIADVIPAKDFRKMEIYELTTGGGFQKVTDSGELTHGSLGHSDRNNQAELYGEMLTLTLKDIVNDDLGAFAKVPFLLGQDAALKLNEVFWTEFLNNSNFFSSGNKNVVASCSFSLDNIGTALATFRNLTNASGKRIGAQPEIVLVPTELESKALNVYKSTEIGAKGSTDKTFGNANPYAGKFRPVVSPYLSDSSISGYSATSWYLLGNPLRRAAMQVAFVGGNQAPTVERGLPEFNTIGISYRAYHAFGCAKADAACGVRCNA